MSDEHYPDEWVKVTLMVSPDGEMHVIGGEREHGDGDQPYVGFEWINTQRRDERDKLKAENERLEAMNVALTQQTAMAENLFLRVTATVQRWTDYKASVAEKDVPMDSIRELNDKERGALESIPANFIKDLIRGPTPNDDGHPHDVDYDQP